MRIFLTYLPIASLLAWINFGISPLFGDDAKLDVCDISYLWPVPTAKGDISALISADTLCADKTAIWPNNVFDAVIKTAQSVKVTNSAGLVNTINFKPFENQLTQSSTWKVAALRVDPSAPGCDPKVIQSFGSTPQIRLILQPVTANADGSVKVFDFTAHLVFNYSKSPGVPDKDEFQKIVLDLQTLKSDLTKASVTTSCPLGVHPGLKRNDPSFVAEVKAMLVRHLSHDRLAAISFMGVDSSEPWIFFAMNKQPDGTFAIFQHPTLGVDAEMLNFRGGTHVVPLPSTTNVDASIGVKTASLFEGDVAARLAQPVFSDRASPQHQDIPDIVANPHSSHFFNTDCVSCHSESARRVAFNIVAANKGLHYNPPAGISSVDISLLPKDNWNVRNFGWFPKGLTVVPTVTMRTANEAADSVDFINRNYLQPSKNGQVPAK
jgi:hypothetical protein